MKRAFVGLSTPIGYGFVHEGSTPRGQTQASPNPFLDSPWGLMLLYDEIVFMTRALCPKNMRDLPYVKFLDESFESAMPTDEELQDVREAVDELTDRTLSGVKTQWHPKRVLGDLPIMSRMDIQAASPLMCVGDFKGCATTDETTLAIDVLCMSKLGDQGAELVTNSVVDQTLGSAWRSAALTEGLVIERIPNYIGADGPYHPIVDLLREHKYLRDYRRWINDSARTTCRAETEDVKLAVECAIDQAINALYMESLRGRLDMRSLTFTWARQYVGDLVSAIVPVDGQARALTRAVREDRAAGQRRWHGFMRDRRKPGLGGVVPCERRSNALR